MFDGIVVIVRAQVNSDAAHGRALWMTSGQGPVAHIGVGAKLGTYEYAKGFFGFGRRGGGNDRVCG